MAFETYNMTEVKPSGHNRLLWQKVFVFLTKTCNLEKKQYCFRIGASIKLLTSVSITFSFSCDENCKPAWIESDLLTPHIAELLSLVVKDQENYQKCLILMIILKTKILQSWPRKQQFFVMKGKNLRLLRQNLLCALGFIQITAVTSNG